ncbi:MAG: beta-galactosidase [Victivallaceae bacterium]
MVSGQNNWIKSGVSMFGMWESLQGLRRIAKDSAFGETVVATSDREDENLDAIYHENYSDSTLRKLKSLNIDVVIYPFFRGFGVSNEQSTRDDFFAVSAKCRKLGLKIGGYVTLSPVFKESLFQEFPEAASWAQVNQAGQPNFYGARQAYRVKLCKNNPGFRTFIKTILHDLVIKGKADLVHFDHVNDHPEPYSCHCAHCRQKFVEFVRNAFTPTELYDLCGLNSPEGIQPPFFHPANPPQHLVRITDPLHMLWIKFRCHTVAESYREWTEYIKLLNPPTAVVGNVAWGFDCNLAYMTGVDHGKLLGIGDMFFSEEFNPAKLSSGSIFSRKRTFLAAAATGSYAVTYAERNGNGLTALAESMALGRGCIGTVKYCTLFSKADFSAEWIDYLKFFTANKPLFARGLPECRINILRNFESLAYDSVESHAYTLAFEQFLIDNSYDCRILFDQNLMSMKQASGVLIAVINQQYLSDAICEKLTGLVGQGATLLVVGDSAKYNEWGRKRTTWGFSKLFGIKTQPSVGMTQTISGKGRAVYIRSLESSSVASINGTCESEDLGQMKSLKYFTHPLYTNPPTLSYPMRIINLLKMLIGDIAEFELVDPDGEIRIELTSLPGGSRVLHIINYGDANAIKLFAIRLKGHLSAINAKSLRMMTPCGCANASVDGENIKIEMQSAYCILTFKLKQRNKEK